MANLTERVGAEFRKRYREEPLLVRSPGRVNLLGEHTDYNDGFVLPAAIDKAIVFAVGRAKKERCALTALDMAEEHEFDLRELRASNRGWPNYLIGVVDQLKRAGARLEGFNCVFGGDIPIGAGLSSSAAIEAGLAFALNRLFSLGLDSLSLVRLAQKAENEFVGVRCGIMDQYVNIFGERGQVLQIDCRSLESKRFPFPRDLAIVLFDTRVSHSLASSEYNRRREECAEGVRTVRTRFPTVTHLRDVSLAMLEESHKEMDQTTFRRCRYVVEENARVISACEALERHDLKAFGTLMKQTHEGLRDDYAVSCPELDALVELTQDDPRVYGSRMMGGGFGGCTINLVERSAVEEVGKRVMEGYRKQFGTEAKTYVTAIDSGTRVVIRQA